MSLFYLSRLVPEKMSHLLQKKPDSDFSIFKEVNV